MEGEKGSFWKEKKQKQGGLKKRGRGEERSFKKRRMGGEERLRANKEFWNGARLGDLEKVVQFTKLFPSTHNFGGVDVADQYNFTALHRAARNGHLSVVKYHSFYFFK